MEVLMYRKIDYIEYGNSVGKCLRYCELLLFAQRIHYWRVFHNFLISKQGSADYVYSVISNYHIDSCIIQRVKACLGKK